MFTDQIGQTVDQPFDTVCDKMAKFETGHNEEKVRLRITQIKHAGFEVQLIKSFY